ncbi:MAG TPA: HAD-IC family P-type ATPase, partial [Puia sp.]|nr:HAD-IC family P-type ATPase [Puia sp.]
MDPLVAEYPASGLTTEEAEVLAVKFGSNEISADRKNPVFRMAWDIIREPMFAMLLLACVVYLILGELQEGGLMIIAMVFVGAISFYQEIKSSNALSALRQYTEPRVLVIRNGEEQTIPSQYLVPGDVIAVEEGEMIPADGVLLQSNDLSVNESILTGESFPVEKTAQSGDKRIFQGTLVNSGRGYAKVIATGNSTVLGKLGRSISSAPVAKTLLQKQISRFVRIMALVGGIVFCLLLALTYWHTGEFLTSLLAALTLVMAIVPEEIPVA